MGSLAAPVKVTETWFKSTLLPYLNGTLEDALDAVRTRVSTAETTLAAKLTPGPNGVTLAQLDPDLQATIGGRTFTYPYTMKVDARASLGRQGATRPDAPIVVWGLDVGQALPAAFIDGGEGDDPKYQGDTAVYAEVG